VHLEVDPLQYESDNATYASLQKSNNARLEIMQDILGDQLGLECSENSMEAAPTMGYFLGRHEVRQPYLPPGDTTTRVAFAFCLILFTSLILMHFMILLCVGAYLFVMQILHIFYLV
jgi:hypothetical protein